jgi:hypothetical protein
MYQAEVHMNESQVIQVCILLITDLVYRTMHDMTAACKYWYKYGQNKISNPQFKL